MESLIGYLAAACTTLAYFPQALKVYKTKHTRDISIWMFLLMNAGLFLWLTYGIIISALPIILANSITIIMALYILIVKIKIDLLKTGNRVFEKQ